MRARILLGTVMVGALALVPISGSSAATKPEFGYVTDALNLPLSFNEANQYGRDMDGDNTRDNNLGEVLATFSGQGLDHAGAMNDALVSGDIVMLHSLRSFSLNNSSNATWQVWYGAPGTSPVFDGTDSFELLAGQPHSAKLAATIKDHVVKTAAGKIPVRLNIGAGVFRIDMVKTKITATCAKSACDNGKIAGAVKAAQVDAKFVPEFAEIFTTIVVRDCHVETEPEPLVVCEPGSDGANVDLLFNTNEDLVITANELRDHEVIQAVLAPDLDLFKADGKPGQDGVKESVSFGFGFTTVKATLTRP